MPVDKGKIKRTLAVLVTVLATHILRGTGQTVLFLRDNFTPEPSSWSHLEACPLSPFLLAVSF